MAVAGSLTYDTKIDKSGFNKGLNSITGSVKNGGTKIKNIIAALGITKIISSAFNIINNSLDGAISRIDTLNNFPKVMSNLEIGAEESSKAINKLSDGLKGLPTTLDSGALAVQRFTSKNGDVNKSVDLFLALNDAILAGGASTEMQSSAIEQISQSYAKGKPDMMEWRTLQTAMPAQIKQIAKAMLGNKDALDKYMKAAEQYSKNNPMSSTGKELIEQMKAVKNGSGDMATALGTALRTGVISMDDFMNTIVKLDKNGGEGIKSFAEQAKNATGGIKTSITNAKTAVVRGVGNIISAIDTGLKKTELKGVGNIISKIGSISEKVLKKVAEEIEKIDFNKIVNVLKRLSTIYMPKIKKILDSLINVIKNIGTVLINNKRIIVSIIGAVISLIAAMKTYKGIMTAIKSIDIAKNIIAALNPTTTLISLTLGLSVAAAAVATAMAKQKTSLDGVKDAAELQQKSWKALKEAREQTIRGNEAEITTTQKLADELRAITDENGKVKEGYENRAKYILGELNSALGTEYQMNGNIIGQYSELKNNIDQLIAKKRAEIGLEAYKEEYQTALKNQSEATKTLTDLRQKYNEELNRTTNGYKEEMEKSKNLAYIGEQIKKQSDLIGEYGYTIENYDKLTSASVSNSKEEIEKALSEMGISYDQAKEKTNASLTEQIQSQSNYVSLLRQSWRDAINSNDTFQANILQKQLDTEQQALINLTNSLAQQTATVGELTEEQKTAWKNLAETSYDAYQQGLLQVPEETRRKIQEATGIVATDTELENATGNEGNQASTAFYNNLTLSNKAKEEVKNASTTINSDTSVGEAAENLGQDVDTSFNQKLDGWTWGFDLVKNIYSGLTSPNGVGLITSGASTLAQIIKNNIGHSIPKEGPLKDELTYMPDMIDNLVMGIDKNRYKVANAANNVAKDIKSSFDLENLNSSIMSEMNKAVAIETGSINASASVKSNNSMLSVIKATFNIDGSVNMDGKKVGRTIAPSVVKTIKAGGLTQ